MDAGACRRPTDRTSRPVICAAMSFLTPRSAPALRFDWRIAVSTVDHDVTHHSCADDKVDLIRFGLNREEQPTHQRREPPRRQRTFRKASGDVLRRSVICWRHPGRTVSRSRRRFSA